jgi:Ca2+-binding RTX toxin-like protein
MGVVTFPPAADILAQINAGYSMFDTGTGAWSYLNQWAPGPGHDPAVLLKEANFIFNVGSFIYSQAAQFSANPTLAAMKMETMAHNLARIGLPLDMASTVADLIVVGNQKGFDSDEYLDAALKFAVQIATLVVAFAITGSLPVAAVFYGLALLYMNEIDPVAGNFVANHLRQWVRDPIVLDLDGDGVTLSTLNSSTVHFDFNGDGFAERTGWVSASDGILAIDRNGNSSVDSGLELFGSSAQDGFAVLETLDSNNDGAIDSSDSRFFDLKVWRDLNQNGVSDLGELQTLQEAGIQSISLSRQSVNGTNAGHGVGYQATFVRADGSSGIAQTIYFQTDGQNTVEDNTPNFTPGEGVLDLPQFAGSGQISSVAYRLTSDASFRSAWTALTDSATEMLPAEFRSAFEHLLLQWAGVDGVDPDSRGPYVDARHLAFIEAFFGDSYREVLGNSELRTYPSTSGLGAVIEADFSQLEKTFELFFLSQVTGSQIARSESGLEGITADNPVFFLGLLSLGPRDVSIPPPTTPANVGMVLELMLGNVPTEDGAAAEYIVRGLSALDALVYIAFAADRTAYAACVSQYLDVIADTTLRDIATHIVDGTARFGTTGAEGLNGTAGQDVFIGGGGGDVVAGGAGSDIYVYEKHDGDLWIRDDGPAADTDRLVLTDLNAADVSFVRIADSLLIKVTATGKAVTVESFFTNNGIDVLRFADGSEWNRTQIKNASIYQGDGHANAILDSAGNDVIHGGQGDDYIRIGTGNDTILWGKGDGYDIIDDSSGSLAEHDKFVLTDLNSSDVELSRVGPHLILTVKSTGEYVDFKNFFPYGTGDWATTARNIDEIRFADGVSWNRAEIQQKAWYRGTDHADNIQGSELNDIISGGKGDDILDGWTGSDTFIWHKGDGNDQISDFSSTFGGSTDVDTLWLQDVSAGDVSYSYQGRTLLLTINSTGEILTIPEFLSGVSDLTTGAGAYGFGIDVIKFADGSTINRQQITYNAGAEYLGWKPVVYTWVVQGG